MTPYHVLTKWFLFSIISSIRSITSLLYQILELNTYFLFQISSNGDVLSLNDFVKRFHRNWLHLLKTFLKICINGISSITIHKITWVLQRSFSKLINIYGNAITNGNVRIQIDDEISSVYWGKCVQVSFCTIYRAIIH